MAGNFITEKVGPLPLVVWVMGGAGAIFVVLAFSHRNQGSAAANQTNQVSSLAPTEAEAFGTIEQQQQDVTNALTTLGNNQSMLGGSMSTLTGIVTQQGLTNAASFQNLQDGQNTIQQGQAAAASTAANYQSTLLAQLANYYNSLFGEVGSGFGGMTTQLNTLGGGIAQVNQAINNDAQAQAAGFTNLAAFLNAQQSQVGTIQNWVSEIKARLQQGDYSAPRWGPSNQPWSTAASQGPGVSPLSM